MVSKGRSLSLSLLNTAFALLPFSCGLMQSKILLQANSFISCVAIGRKITAGSQLKFSKAMSTSGTNGDDGTLDDPNHAVGRIDIGKMASAATTSTTDDCDIIIDSAPVATASSSWRQLLEVSIAKTRKIRGSNYVQIATIDPITQEPRCRTVVFRGMLPNVPHDHELFYECNNLSCVLRIMTDRRSEKYRQILKHSATELVWWFPKTSEQYRIRGRLVLVGGCDDKRSGDTMGYDDDSFLKFARKELWGNISDSARESFFDSRIPGDAIMEVSPKAIPKGGRGADGRVLQPPHENFVLLLLVPSSCDYLRLTDGQHRQIDVQIDRNNWLSRQVNP